MRGLHALGVGIGVAAAAIGCSRQTLFNCADDSACQAAGQTGTCEPNGLCSFPDGACASGRRFAEGSGPASDLCVDPDGGDATSGPGSSGTNGTTVGSTADGTAGGSSTTVGGCAPGQLQCGTMCVDVDSDPKNCGDCGVLCSGNGGESTCSGGVCVTECQPGFTMLDGDATCIACAPTSVFDSQPVAYWRLGEAEPEAVAFDSGPVGINGQYQAVGLGTPGVAPDGDTAATFGGANDSAMAVLQYDLDQDGEFSVVLWLRTTVTTQNMGLFSYATLMTGREFLITGAEEIDVWFQGNQALSFNEDLSDGQWHQLAVAVTVNNVDVFVDGVFVGNSLAQPPGSGGLLVLGQAQATQGMFDPLGTFVGDLDEVAVYDRALTEQELRTQYLLMLCQ